MKSIKIQIMQRLPSDATGIQTRIEELLQAQEAIRQELRLLIGTGVYLPPGSKEFTCVRCEYFWKTKRMTVRPVICPRCKSRSWDRPRIYKQRSYRFAKHVEVSVPEMKPEVKENLLEALGFPPPPVAPKSLREMLQPAAETESDTPSPLNTEQYVTAQPAESLDSAPGSDQAEPQPNESEEVQESLSDA